MLTDKTASVMLDGYCTLSRLRASAGKDTVPFRFLGRRATCLVGPEATRLFYDDGAFDREGVVPPPVRSTLFGDAGVQLLDGDAHRHRKSLFGSVLDHAGTASLTETVGAAWAHATPRWRGREVVLFDESARLLCRAVHDWAGVPLPDEDVPAVTRDLLCLVEGFAGLGPRHLAGRRARRRLEQRLEALVRDVRAGAQRSRPGSPLQQVVEHQETDGSPLDEHTAAVEVLNLLRPTVAIAWFVAFAAHALHHWPHERAAVAGSDDAATAFAHEVRRFYPLTPLLAARAVRDLTFDGVEIPENSLGVLDVFGQDHHPDLWDRPWTFSSRRFLDRPPGAYDLVPQGGGDVHTGHRCPGEPAVVAVLAALTQRLAVQEYDVPVQDLRVTRHRIPARVRSRMRIAVRV